MKFYPNNISTIIQKIKSGEILSLVLYGPDSGMISLIIRNIAEKLNCKIASYVKSDNDSIYGALNSRSLFAEKEVVKISYGDFTLDEHTKNIFKSQNVNFPLIIADELNSSNALRKFFETTKETAIIGCYPDDEKSIKQLIIGIIVAMKKQIDPEAIDFLAEKLSGDRMLIVNEVEKLIAYSGKKLRITLDDAKDVISGSVIGNPDILCISFANKNYQQYFNELQNLLENSISEVWIIRALARFYQNIIQVKICASNGMNTEAALATLKPPIFFKYKDGFIQIVTSVTLKEASETLQDITDAELKIKTGYSGLKALEELVVSRL